MAWHSRTRKDLRKLRGSKMEVTPSEGILTAGMRDGMEKREGWDRRTPKGP